MGKSSSIGSSESASPRRLGYRFPAEWEAHAATWLSWPHNAATWPAGLEPVQRDFARLVARISEDEPVHLNVRDESMASEARCWLRDAHAAAQIVYHFIPTNDAWCRDHGAIFLVRAEPRSSYPPCIAIDWEYNAWGGKYPPYDLDNAVPCAMARALEMPCVAGGMVLEGGSIETNGAGVLLTTERCLLDPNRNPRLSREHIERRLSTMLGLQQVLWLQHGLHDDDTDGHIDNVARFVARHTVVAAVEPDPLAPDHHPLQENLRRLRAMRLDDGQQLDVVELPIPPIRYADGMRLPASYLNFYLTNRSVLVPQYDEPQDAVAGQVLARLFPGRRVVEVDCRAIIGGLGAIHCLTQQVPLAPPLHAAGG